MPASHHEGRRFRRRIDRIKNVTNQYSEDEIRLDILQHKQIFSFLEMQSTANRRCTLAFTCSQEISKQKAAWAAIQI